MSRERICIPLLLSIGLVLAGCQSAPPPRPEPGQTRSAPTPFEKHHVARAVKLDKQQRHHEAAIEWEILSLYAPGESSYRQKMKAARKSADSGARRHLAKARKALASGNEQRAGKHFLLALSLDPKNAAAAKGLRKLEQTRNRRHFLGRPTRLTIGRKNGYRNGKPTAATQATKQAAPKKIEKSAQAAPRDQGELEHASLLLRDGEYTEALAMLARYVKANPDDHSAQIALGEAWEAYGNDSLGKGRLKAALRAYLRAERHLSGNDEKLAEKIEALKKSLGPT